MPVDPALSVRRQLLTAILARVAQLDLKSGDLGDRLGLTRTRLVRLLDGDARAFNLDALVRIAARLDLETRVVAARPQQAD